MISTDNFETYDDEEPKEEKKSLLKKMWDNTIGKKLKEKAEENELRQEAMEEAKSDIREAMKKKFVAEAIEKINKPKKNILTVMSNEFKLGNSKEKIQSMIQRDNGAIIAERIAERGKLKSLSEERLPNIRPDIMMSRQKAPRAKVENLNIKGRSFDAKLREALKK